jgi:hypothetical protein
MNDDWYFKDTFVYLMLFIFGPLALPLVWFNPRYTKRYKIVSTIVCVVMTIIITALTAKLVTVLFAYIHQIQTH